MNASGVKPSVGLLPPDPMKDYRQSARLLTDRRSPAKQVPQIDRSKVDPKVVEAAEGMESVFIDYMLKVMRETVPDSGMDLESPATKIYRSMLDSEIAKKAAQAGGIGLGDQIIAYLESRRYNQVQGQGAPATRTGGTDEGQPIRK